MSDYNFSSAQRYAVYATHGERCYLCTYPLNLSSMVVDHVLPEALIRRPIELGLVLKSFGLPSDFDLNSFANWLPACQPCNLKKRDTVFQATPLVQINLQNASKKAEKAAALARETIGRKKVAHALNVIERANEAGELSTEARKALEPLIVFHTERRDPTLAGEPIRLTPLYEILSEDGHSRIVRGPYGVGARPVAEHVDPSFNCPNCGSIAAWSGARCVICGTQSED